MIIFVQCSQHSLGADTMNQGNSTFYDNIPLKMLSTQPLASFCKLFSLLLPILDDRGKGRNRRKKDSCWDNWTHPSLQDIKNLLCPLVFLSMPHQSVIQQRTQLLKSSDDISRAIHYPTFEQGTGKVTNGWWLGHMPHSSVVVVLESNSFRGVGIRTSKLICLLQNKPTIVLLRSVCIYEELKVKQRCIFVSPQTQWSSVSYLNYEY